MRVGVLEILAGPARGITQRLMNAWQVRQYASVMPQSIAYWCQQDGHEVHYATYYGLGSLFRLPDDLDVLFVSCTTQHSALAYIAANEWARHGALTVIGGPHAKCYPADCRRFFDVVVNGPCNKELVQAIANCQCQGYVNSSPPTRFPSVFDRMQFVREAAGRRTPAKLVPVLTSLGCPNGCAFCTDWNNEYQSLVLSEVFCDLLDVKCMPGWIMAIHDANLGPHLDWLLSAMLDLGWNTPWVMETDLRNLTEDRMRMLARTRCCFVGAGVESWSACGAKSGTHGLTPEQKLDHVVEKFTELSQYVPYVQAGMMFPNDDDCGMVPIAYTQQFIRRVPRVWPTISLPVAFGGTPLFKKYAKEGRLLPVPFAFYNKAYLTNIPANYTPSCALGWYASMLEFASSFGQWRKRTDGQPWRAKAVEWFRACEASENAKTARKVQYQLDHDQQMRRFHDGETTEIPEWYWHEQDRFLGPYAGYLDRKDLTPVLE